MRIRQIKPEFWSDPVTSELIDLQDTALFYIGLWMDADDAGWLRWEPRRIAAALYPYRSAEEREAAVLMHKVALEAGKRLRVLKCGHANIPSLPDHQRISESKLVTTILREHQQNCSRESPRGNRRSRGAPRVPAIPRVGRVGYGRVGNGNSAPARESNGTVNPDTIRSYVKSAHSTDSAVRQSATRWLADHQLSPEGEPVES